MELFISLSQAGLHDKFIKLSPRLQASYLKRNPKSPVHKWLLDGLPALKPVTVYRVEHTTSGLGPYQHGTQDGLNEAFNPTIDVMKDLDEIPIVQALFNKYPRSVFGFDSKVGCTKFIRSRKEMKKYGFIIKVYKNIKPLFVSEDGQVIFNK